MGIPNFSAAANEIAYWLGHIAMGYGAKEAGGGTEKGIDVTLPYHTPIYAVASGTILGTGYYGGGGVVSENLPGVTPASSFYYQHLSDIVAKAGQAVNVGDLIGYSGGQNGYGDHPASTYYSTWPHIEIGVNGPWGAPWDPQGANVNPVNLLTVLEASALGGSSYYAANPPSSGGGCQNNTPFFGFWGTLFCNLGTQAQNLVATITGIVAQFLIRIGVILAGAVLLFLALRVLLRDTAGGAA